MAKTKTKTEEQEQKKPGRKRGPEKRFYVETLRGVRYSIPEVQSMIQSGETVTSLAKKFEITRQRLSTLLNRGGKSAPELMAEANPNPKPPKKEKPKRELVEKKVLLQLTEKQYKTLTALDNPQQCIRDWIDSLECGDKPPKRQDAATRGCYFPRRYMASLTESQHYKTRTIWSFRQKLREWLDTLEAELQQTNQ